MYIDSPLLYGYETPEWRALCKQADSGSGFWAAYAKRKIRRTIKQLLNGIRPRVTY